MLEEPGQNSLNNVPSRKFTIGSMVKLTLSLFFPILFGIMLASYPLQDSILGVRPFRALFVGVVLMGVLLLICCRKEGIYKRIPWPALAVLILSLASYFNRILERVPLPNLEMTHLIGSFIIYLLMFWFFKEEEKYKRAVTTWILVAFFVVATLVVWHVIVFRSPCLTPIFSEKGYWYEGYATKNGLALFLVILFPFLYTYATEGKRLVNWVGVILCSGAIIYVLSRGALVGLALTFLVLGGLAIKANRYRIQLAAVVLICLVLNMTTGIGISSFMKWKANASKLMIKRDPKAAENFRQSKPEERPFISYSGSRGRYILLGMKGFLKKPFFGYGLGSFRHNNAEFDKEGRLVQKGGLIRRPSTHNNYILILYEHGLIGILIWGWFILDALFRLWRSRKHYKGSSSWIWNATFASLIVSLFSFLYININQTILFWFIVGGAGLVARFHHLPPTKEEVVVP